MRLKARGAAWLLLAVTVVDLLDTALIAIESGTGFLQPVPPMPALDTLVIRNVVVAAVAVTTVVLMYRDRLVVPWGLVLGYLLGLYHLVAVVVHWSAEHPLTGGSVLVSGLLVVAPSVGAGLMLIGSTPELLRVQGARTQD